MKNILILVLCVTLFSCSKSDEVEGVELYSAVMNVTYLDGSTFDGVVAHYTSNLRLEGNQIKFDNISKCGHEIVTSPVYSGFYKNVKSFTIRQSTKQICF